MLLSFGADFSWEADTEGGKIPGEGFFRRALRGPGRGMRRGKSRGCPRAFGRGRRSERACVLPVPEAARPDSRIKAAAVRAGIAAAERSIYKKVSEAVFTSGLPGLAAKTAGIKAKIRLPGCRPPDRLGPAGIFNAAVLPQEQMKGL